jgi:hypothetical protein
MFIHKKTPTHIRKAWLSLLLVILAFSLVSCAGSQKSESTYFDSFDDGAESFAAAPSPKYEKKRKAKRKPRSADRSMSFASEERMAFLDEPSAVFVMEEEPNIPEPSVEARKMHYSGQLTLRSNNPKSILDSAEKMMQKINGFVESRSQNSIELRVPVALFDSTWESLQKLAPVLRKSMSASDITDQFNDTELRVRLHRSKIERLKELIAKSKDDQEKLALLRELKNATEQLQALEVQLQTLSSLADYSSITLYISSQSVPGKHGMQAHAFKWMKGLDAFYRSYPTEECKRLELSVPPLMVELKDENKKEHLWRAAGSEGADVWAFQMKNNPSGSADFWMSAFINKEAKQFKTANRSQVGSFELVEFTPWSDISPYYFIVAMRVNKDMLEIIQIYLPNKKQKDKHWAEIKTMLEKAKQENPRASAPKGEEAQHEK